MRHRRLVIPVLVLLLVTVMQIAAPIALYSDPVVAQIFYNPTVPYYYYPAGYAATVAFSFMAGAAVGAALRDGCNWGEGDVHINVNKYNNFTKYVNRDNAQGKRSRADQRGRDMSGRSRGETRQDGADRGGADRGGASVGGAMTKFNPDDTWVKV